MNKRKRGEDQGDVDNGIVDQLSGILANGSLDSTPLLTFFEKGHVQQVIQAWSYYAQTSNHGKIAATGPKIARLLSVCNENSVFLKYEGDVIRYILEDYMKVIYRCLFVSRSNVTNPVLHILTEITKFNKGALIPDLFSAFDFTIKIIPKLLASETGGMRKAFLEFYLSFVTHGSYIIRKDLISQKKVVSGWLKHICELDDDEMIIQTLEVFINCILKEPAFLKATKIGFFNDWVMGRIVKLLSNKSKVVIDKTVEFLTILCLDSEIGVLFPDSGWSAAEVNNRLILTIVKLLKPWEDIDQQNLVVKILGTCSELISPYVSDVLNTTSFDPKLTSWWVSFATLLSRVCELPINETQLLLFDQPSAEIVLNNTLPFKTSSITKSLQFSETPLIRYLAAQTLLFGIRRLLQVKKIYQMKEWDFQQVLVEARAQRLPNAQTVFALATSCQKEQPLLKTLQLQLINEYATLSPADESGRSLPLVGDWTDSDIKGLELVQVEASLDIQLKFGGLGKWWNKSGAQEYSMFTTLLRLATLNESLSEKIIGLLITLVTPTLLFQDETPVHPVETLVNAVLRSGDDSRVWNLIEESVSRCMRAPYKYVDTFADVRQSEFSCLSPLAVTLMEQLQFVEDREDVDKWVCKFMRDSCVCGEDWNSALVLAQKHDLKHVRVLKDGARSEWLQLYPIEDYFDFVLASSDEAILARTDLMFKIRNRMDMEATKYRALRSPLDVAKHILTSLPMMDEIQQEFVKLKFFRDFLLHRDSAFADLYLSLVSPDLDTSELKRFMLDKGIARTALWLHETENIIELAMNDKTATKSCVLELSRRNVRIPLNAVSAVSEGADESTLTAISRNIGQHRYEDSSAKDICSVMDALSASATPVLCALIQATGRVSQGIDVNDLSDSVLVDVTVAISKYAPSYLPLVDVSRAFDVGINISTLPLYTVERLRANEDLAKKVFSFISSLTGPSVLSLDVVRMMGDLYQLDEDNAFVQKWFSQCFLWLTKQFAEDNSGHLSAVVKSLLAALDSEVKKVDIWKVAGKRILNSWIESSVRWLSAHEVLVLVNRVVFAANSKSGIEYSKILQLVINNKTLLDNKLAVLVWKLFTFDEKGQVGIQQIILQQMLEATSDPNDWLLLDIVGRIEGQSGKSWASQVMSWTIREGDSRLMIATRDGLEVVLDPQRINQSIRSFQSTEWFEPSVNDDYDHLIEKIDDYRRIYGDGERSKARYNPAFLMYSLVSSDIFSSDDVNIKKLVDSNGMAFIVGCLGSPRLGPAARLVIQRLANTEMTKYKERTAVRLVAGKLMTSFAEEEKAKVAEEDFESIKPSVYLIIGLLVSVMTNPGHYLYERASEFLLSGPSIKGEHIPLLKSISKSDSDFSRREINWLLDVLTVSLQTEQDVNLYLRRNVFEWALSLPESLFGESQKRLIAKAQETPGGSVRLITRNGGVAWSEMRKDDAVTGRFLMTAGDKFTSWSGISGVYVTGVE